MPHIPKGYVVFTMNGEPIAHWAIIARIARGFKIKDFEVVLV